jgi:hypothetical protein
MDQRVFTVKEFREKDVSMLGELGQDGEDQMSLGMTPPGSTEGLTRDHADNAWKGLVLCEEKAFLCENRENGIGCPHATGATLWHLLEDQAIRTQDRKGLPALFEHQVSHVGFEIPMDHRERGHVERKPVGCTGGFGAGILLT